jgi:hypothetical protein
MTTAVKHLRRLLRQERGIAVTEFGLIAPVFFLLLLGLYDITHTAYAKSVFSGAVERAARVAALETGDPDAADQMIEDLVRPVLPDVEITTERQSYFDFADIGRPELFTDSNTNGICDNNESFTDLNGNGERDEDIGLSGNGGSSDVVMYTVTATYTPLFKVPFLPESWNTRTMTATAVKKNQPFSNQTTYTPTPLTCSDS